MLRTRLIAMLAGVLVAALTSISNTAFAAPSASVDDTARFLAGLPPSAGSPLTPFTKEAFWQQHAKTFDASWSGLEKRQLSKIRGFTAKNFNDPQPALFYFFSGADFLYADTFFPSANTYIMAGLEPPGAVPDLNKLSRPQLAGGLRELRGSLESIMSYSFFRTKSMRIDFGKARLPGTLPVLMTFLARSGKTINEVTLIDLQRDGTIHPTEDKVPDVTAKGARIIFSDNIGKTKTLYYFSTDLSDGGIKTSGFTQFCDTFRHADSFIKSASYLMHQDHFSTVRDYLLNHSASILEDDSGIPIRYFAHGWRLHPYGRYVGPIALFRGQYQSQLSQVFRKDNVIPIDFGIGYRWRSKESNLLLAVKDGTVTAMELPPPGPEDKASRSRSDVKVSREDVPRRHRRAHHRHNEETVFYPYKFFGYSP